MDQRDQHGGHEGWESELERLGGAVRPTGPVGAAMTARVGRVGRRRARRRTAVVAGGAAAVAAVVVSASLVGPGATSSAPPATTPTSTATATAEPAEPEPFRCPWMEGRPEAPPIADLAAQQELAREVREPAEDFAVTTAEPSPVGLLVLVDGDLATARRVLGARGVQHVWQDRGSAPSVNWVTDPVLEALRTTYGERPGAAGWGVWDEAGQVIVRWRSPVPAEIAALAGSRPDGVEVVVEERPYSSAQLLRAQDRSVEVLGDLGLRDDWLVSGACDGGAGIVVGMSPLPEDPVALQEQLARALGLPVMVVAEEPYGVRSGRGTPRR